jgi:hypothetical protein
MSSQEGKVSAPYRIKRCVQNDPLFQRLKERFEEVFFAPYKEDYPNFVPYTDINSNNSVAHLD